MHLFISLAYVVNGDSQLSRESHKKTQFLLKNSGYWQFRFSQYNLDLILMNPPNKPNSVYEIMNHSDRTLPSPRNYVAYSYPDLIK